jgi:hypothetical protein
MSSTIPKPTEREKVFGGLNRSSACEKDLKSYQDYFNKPSRSKKLDDAASHKPTTKL